MTSVTLGDRRPSDLLRIMKEMSCDKVGDDLLKELWLQRLPVSIQIVLSTSNDDLDQLTVMADSMFEISEASNIQAITSDQTKQFSDLVKFVYKLDGKLGKLSKNFQKSGKRSNQSQRYRSPTPSRAPSVKKRTLCYYHKRFGDKANKCKVSSQLQKFKKLVRRSRSATTDHGPSISRLYVTDKSSGREFLIDTGADISVIPPTSR